MDILPAVDERHDRSILTRHEVLDYLNGATSYLRFFCRWSSCSHVTKNGVGRLLVPIHTTPNYTPIIPKAFKRWPMTFWVTRSVFASSPCLCGGSWLSNVSNSTSSSFFTWSVRSQGQNRHFQSLQTGADTFANLNYTQDKLRWEIDALQLFFFSNGGQ